MSETPAPKLEGYFRAMAKAQASDLHMKGGLPPFLRLRSQMQPSQVSPMTHEAVEEMALELLHEEQKAILKKSGSIDLAYEIADGDRYRINIYRQRGHLAVAVRRVTREIPTFETLHLPDIVRAVSEEHQGLVLLSGPTGSGKSTTIAAMLQHINETRACHIVSIEDPIEYLYESRKALVSQREIGIDASDFDTALRALMREDPDVVLIGELRDWETFNAAVQASETGHLVFGTVHASTAPQTIGRIVELFPEASQNIVRQALATNIRAVICQRLLPCIADGVDRVPAVEVMLTNPSVRQLISEDRDSELVDVIASTENQGMQSFTTSLLYLIENAFVDPRVAYEAAPNVDELKMRLKGISASRAGMRR